MAEFTVNAQRFDPYKNFKFRVKWDGKYVLGISKVGTLKRTTEVVKHREGGDPSSSRKSPGRTEYDAISLERGVTHDPEFEVWANKVWRLGAGLNLKSRLGRFPQGHHPGDLQRGRPARARLQYLSRLGFGVSGDARSRRQRERGGDPAHQAGERGLGTRHHDPRADGTQLHLSFALIRHACPDGHRSAGGVGARPGTEPGRARPWRCSPSRRPHSAARPLADVSIGARDAALVALREAMFGTKLNGCVNCPRCGETMECDVTTPAIRAPPAAAETVSLNECRRLCADIARRHQPAIFSRLSAPHPMRGSRCFRVALWTQAMMVRRPRFPISPRQCWTRRRRRCPKQTHKPMSDLRWRARAAAMRGRRRSTSSRISGPSSTPGRGGRCMTCMSSPAPMVGARPTYWR